MARIEAIETEVTAQLTFPVIENAERLRALAQAEGDRRGHRETLVFPIGVPATVRYCECKPCQGGCTVRYGYTLHPNAAGYHLIFRETIVQPKRGPQRVTRDQFDSTIRKSEAAHTCRRLADSFSAHTGRKR